ncbi:MAG: hypothetical protein ACOYKZ_07615 [Chlamydiia bacterium]
MKAKVMILGALCTLATAGVAFGHEVVCADFCEGQPLVNDDGATTRTIFLDRCNRHDTFAASCDNPHKTVSCACVQTSDGNFKYAPGSEHGGEDRCGALCPTLKGTPIEDTDDGDHYKASI